MQFGINCRLVLYLLFEDRSLSTGVWVTGALSQREWGCSLCAQWALTCRWWWRTWWGAVGVEQCCSDPALTCGGHCATAGCWGTPTPPWGGGGHRRSIPPACREKERCFVCFCFDFCLFCFNFACFLYACFVFIFAYFLFSFCFDFCLFVLIFACSLFCFLFVLFYFFACFLFCFYLAFCFVCHLFWWGTGK